MGSFMFGHKHMDTMKYANLTAGLLYTDTYLFYSYISRPFSFKIKNTFQFTSCL